MIITDLTKVSDRALIALQVGLNELWRIEYREQRNGFYPEIGTTTGADLDFADAVMQEIERRAHNIGYRFCANHLLPLVSPDACEGCAAAHITDEEV